MCLGIAAHTNHPIHMVFTAYPVLPPAVRPSAHMPTTKSVGNNESEYLELQDTEKDDIVPEEDEELLPDDEDVPCQADNDINPVVHELDDDPEDLDAIEPLPPPKRQRLDPSTPAKKLHQHTYLQAAASIGHHTRFGAPGGMSSEHAYIETQQSFGGLHPSRQHHGRRRNNREPRL